MKNKIEVKEKEVKEEVIIPKVGGLEEKLEEISYFFPNQRKTVRALNLRDALQKLNKE